MPDSEPVEVLSASSPGFRSAKHYIVRLKHATGIVRVIAQAVGHRAAISQVLDASGAPRSAVLSVQKFKWIENTSHSNGSTRLKELKYASDGDANPE